jgi:hypothetical protein
VRLQIRAEIDKIVARYREVTHRRINYNPPSWCPPDTEVAQLVRANAKEIAGIDPTPIVSLGGTDARLWRYKDIPAIVYGQSPTGMGSVDEHVTVDEFLHVAGCHVLSAYDYMSRPGDGSKASILPLPACGERDGVRGIWRPHSSHKWRQKLPLTRKLRCAQLPTSPRRRGEVIGRGTGRHTVLPRSYRV